MTQEVRSTIISLTIYLAYFHSMDYVADCGDYVVVTNARNIHVTGKKAQQKVYYHHTMYPGGLKERHFKDLIKSKPEDVRIIFSLFFFFLFSSLSLFLYWRPCFALRTLQAKELTELHMTSFYWKQIIREAVSGMLPKNKLRDRRLERLRIFADEDMGTFKHNILKRWEDGTLPSENVPKSS